MLDVFDGILAARLCGAGGASPTPPAPEPTLITKTVTANGTYNAEDDNADGYSAVTVEVPQLPVTFLRSIKSEGNSVIRTNIVPDYNWDVYVDAKFETNSAGGEDIFFGVRYPTEHFLMALSYGSGWSTYVAWSGFTAGSGDTYSVSDIMGGIGIRNTYVMRRGAGKCIAGDKSYVMTNRTSDTAPTIPVMVAGFDNEGTVTPFGKFDMTIYGIQIQDAYGTPIHSLVPAKAKSNGRAGLYDVITGTFYPSDPNYDDFIKEEVT